MFVVIIGVVGVGVCWCFGVLRMMFLDCYLC